MILSLDAFSVSSAITLGAVLLIAITGWFFSLWADEVSIVRPLWPIMVLVCTFIYSKYTGAQGSLNMAIQLMVLIWSLRMALFLLIRDHYRPEQRQYRLMRIELSDAFYRKSLTKIFFSHALSAWIASSLFAVIFFDIATGARQWNDVHTFAIGAFTVGLMVQTIADYQLYRFSKNMKQSSDTFEKGLWKYSRHPNYFAECLIWWSWGIFALPSANIFAIISPIFITYLMVKVKGAQEIEDDIALRRPDYKKYVKSTSFMVPWRSKL